MEMEIEIVACCGLEAEVLAVVLEPSVTNHRACHSVDERIEQLAQVVRSMRGD